VLQADAFDYIRQGDAQTFDVVFLDPPFAADCLGELCRLLDEGQLLADGAHVYVEEDRAAPAVDLPGRWELLKRKAAGNVRYSLASVGPRTQGETR